MVQGFITNVIARKPISIIIKLIKSNYLEPMYGDYINDFWVNLANAEIFKLEFEP